MPKCAYEAPNLVLRGLSCARSHPFLYSISWTLVNYSTSLCLFIHPFERRKPAEIVSRPTTGLTTLNTLQMIHIGSDILERCQLYSLLLLLKFRINSVLFHETFYWKLQLNTTVVNDFDQQITSVVDRFDIVKVVWRRQVFVFVRCSLLYFFGAKLQVPSGVNS